MLAKLGKEAEQMSLLLAVIQTLVGIANLVVAVLSLKSESPPNGGHPHEFRED